MCTVQFKMYFKSAWAESRASNFPAEIIIPGKDEPETGIQVNFRHGNFRRKAVILETFSGGNFSDGKFSRINFSNGKLFDG